MNNKRMHLPALILFLCMIFSLTACGDESSSSVSTVPDQTQTDSTSLLQNIPDNILMAVHLVNNSHSEENAFLTCDRIDRSLVKSITFLDTLSGMPDTAWDVSEAQDGSVMAWLDNETHYIQVKIL